MTGEQGCVQMERRYDKVIQRSMLDFVAYRIERTGAAAKMMPSEDGARAEMAAEAAEGVSGMMLPGGDEHGAITEMAAEAAEGVMRHEADVTHVTKHTEKIMKLRPMKRWEGVLRRAVKAGATEQVRAEDELLQLGTPAAHWRELEVRAKLEKGEWVIFNVNLMGCVHSQSHCRLLREEVHLTRRELS